jgi:predicted nucleotidyltransferase
MSVSDKNITDKEYDIIIRLLAKHFRNPGVRCYLFGSAADNTMVTSSDIDLLIVSSQNERTRISHFREDIDDSNITRNVDVVWHENAPVTLIENVTKRGALIWKN